MLIFNFHHVEPQPLHESRKHITITPKGLRNFIRTMRSIGLNPVDLREIIDKGGPEAFPERSLLITFDDGYQNFYEHALPVLEAERCPATMFVLGNQFSGTNHWDQGDLPTDERDQLMSLEQMKTVARSRYVTFGGHAMHHENLPTLSEPELDHIMAESYRILSAELGDAFLPAFAYPFGYFSDKVLASIRKSPYEYAFTTEKGKWTQETDPHQIPRYSAYFRDGNPFILVAKLARNSLLF